MIQFTLGTADDAATETDETTNSVFTIGNEPGAELPSSGGPGTRIFTILGAMLIAAAGAFVLGRRKSL